MTEKTGSPLEAVSSLLEERQRYEVWLSTLESRRATTPPHVYARVHADYDKRLTEVTDQLTSRTNELQEMAKELRGRIDRHAEEENRRRDARAEAELRATVGEFTPDQWNELRERTDGEIARLSAEAAQMREELARLEDLLRTASSPRRSREGPAVSGSTAAQPSSGGRPASAPGGAPAVSSRSDERAAEPARAASDKLAEPGMDTRGFDELAFLHSVVDARDSGRGRPADAANPPRTQTPAPTAPAVRQPTPAASSPVSASPADGEGGGGRTTAPGRRMPEPGGSPAPSAPAAPADESRVGGPSHARESIPSFLKDVPNEQVKTLRCQECGTMNYPTEWYCERCGGELAAM